MSLTRSSPDNDGATPPLPVSVEEMVPPSESTATLGRSISPPLHHRQAAYVTGTRIAVQRAVKGY
jgi:hypothetical protein